MANDRRALLRQRFDSIDQLKAHLHLSDGRVLLLYRDPAFDLAGGSKVLLEISFATSEQSRVVRANVLARTDGQGSWLAIADGRALQEVRDGGLSERRGRRLGADLPLRIRRGGGDEYLVTLIDLSVGGARIGGGLPRPLAPGSNLELSLVSPCLGQPASVGAAAVKWVDGGEAGLLFDRSSADCRVAVNRLFQSLQQEWERVRHIHHPTGCCVRGAMLDPPRPRLHRDGKEDLRL